MTPALENYLNERDVKMTIFRSESNWWHAKLHNWTGVLLSWGCGTTVGAALRDMEENIDRIQRGEN